MAKYISGIVVRTSNTTKIVYVSRKKDPKQMCGNWLDCFDTRKSKAVKFNDAVFAQRGLKNALANCEYCEYIREVE